MAIANPASTKPGTQDQSERQSLNSIPEAGVELEAAPPAGVRPAASDGGRSARESAASHLAGFSESEIKTIEEKFQRLLDTVHANRPADDLEIIRKAWAFCLQQHEGQKRASGEPYVIHPLEVGQVLAELKMDSTAIAAGLLHD